MANAAAESSNIARLAFDALEIDTAIASGGTQTFKYTPDRDHDVEELRLSLYDANYAPFVSNPTSSGNTAQAAAVPSLHAIRVEIKEQGNLITQRPIIAALIFSATDQQRVFPKGFRFYQGVDYFFKFTNNGPIAVAAGQVGFIVNRLPAR